jgi:hypothetical protein
MNPIARSLPSLPAAGFLLLAAAGLLAPRLRADHEDFVVISATASKAYTQHKYAAGAPRPESYVFYQGRYLGGATRDPSIDHDSFLAIARTLAPDLAKQNYLPLRTSRPAAADLLIVVNWGTTVTDPMYDKTNPETQFQLEDLTSSIRDFNAGGAGGMGNLNAQLAISDVNQQAQESEMAANSRLLGYDTALEKEGRMAWATPDGMTALEASHLSDLIDERYFVILLAYDYQKLQRASAAAAARHQAAPQPKPVWSLRMNIRAAGNNFVEALPAMSQAASNYFGKQLDDLVTTQAAIGSQSHVEVGEPKVLNVVK